LKLLLDEHLSPTLIVRCAERGIVAQSVVYLDLGSTDDHLIWRYAFEHDFVVVTTNARHFLRLLDVELHPGLIVLREGGLTRREQWERLARVLDHIERASEPAASYMVNRVIDVLGPEEQLVVRRIPSDPTVPGG
jgi:predicted nuclease of predicted toxin-antitoxin system